MSAPVITDREIQLAAERVRKAGDEQIAVMLEQLLDFREHSRAAVTEHDFRTAFNGGIAQLIALVGQSGCQWWQCDRQAQTARVRRGHSREYSCLCCAHADEGTSQGLWYEEHFHNVRLKQEDGEARARAAWLAAEQQALEGGYEISFAHDSKESP